MMGREAVASLDSTERQTPARPALSVILVTPAGYDEVRTTLRHLAAQSIVNRIELVLVTPHPKQARLPASVAERFHSVRIVPVPDVRSLAMVKASAVPHTTADIVAFAEDHSFPDAGWADAMLAGHARGYSGVAPEMKNGNPDSLLSWVAMFLHFGGVVAPATGFEAAYPEASHNMSYRRDALLALGDELGRRMLAETFLHEALRERGHRMWVEPRAVTRHVNITYFWPLIRHAWLGGRMYGGLRPIFGKWSVLRRLIYACGSPLIPLVRLRRTIQTIRRAGYAERLLPRALLPIVVLLVVHATAEATGYLLGIGSIESPYSELEFARDRFVLPADRALWA